MEAPPLASPYALDVRDDCTGCLLTPAAFCNLSPEARAALNAVKFTAIYPKGSPLFVEGEMPRGVYVLCSGRVKITTSSAEGKTLIMRIAHPGEILGVSATVIGQPYEVSAETIEPSQLNFIKRNDFLRLLSGSAELCLNAVRQLSARYHDAQREIRSLGLAHNTSEKLARLFLDWCATGGTATGAGIRVRVLFTHEEIAQMIGSTRETVTRLLSDFKRRKILEVKGSTVIVLKKSDLETMVSI